MAIIPVVLVFGVLATSAKAQDPAGGGGQSLKELIEGVIIPDILNPLVSLAIAIAVVVFMFGVVKYVKAGGNAEEMSKGSQMIIYGLVGLFVMLSVWGLVNVLITTFNLSGGDVPIPQSGGEVM